MFDSLKDLMGKNADSDKISERDHAILKFDKLAEGWNLEKIQDYMRGNVNKEPLSDIGMASILIRFIERRKDERKVPSGQRREFESMDRAERTKKGFDIVILMANQSILSTDTIPLIKAFLDTYLDVVQHLDQELSQTYESKLKAAYKTAELNALAKSQFRRELNLKYDT